MSAERPDAAVLGCGAVGRRIARMLVASGVERIVVGDPRPGVAERLAAASGPRVRVAGPSDAAEAGLVVFAHPGDHASAARWVLEAGRAVVSVADDLEETRRLLDLSGLAAAREATLVVGAAMSPGISGLLARILANRLDEVDEIHVAVHGTGGPACARQHHRSLAGTAQVWHDHEWLERPAGSGRELCWFPDPAGPQDCYRAEQTDPLLLHESFPTASRIGARMSATRRDRLTARLPMLRPPHADGGVGGLRVEVRGTKDGMRRAEIAGIAERPSIAAAVMAGVMAVACLESMLPPGRVLVGDEELPNQALLERLRAAGITVYEFVGAAGIAAV